MDDEQPTYRFRWTNIDMDAFREQRRCAAQALRRDAEILMRRADQIEAEVREWYQALEEVEPPPARDAGGGEG